MRHRRDLSPNINAIIWSAIHWLPRLDIEGLVKFLHVGQRAVCTIPLGKEGVGTSTTDETAAAILAPSPKRPLNWRGWLGGKPMDQMG
eukprot:scaffold86480_cov27-Tisochrysis_lutea.AAC.6